MDNLIYDRTQADVNRAIELNAKYNDGTITADEITEWDNFLKGAIDYQTLNRVGEWVEYLSDKLNSYSYLQTTSPKTDWVETDFMSVEQSLTYLQNIRTLMNAINVQFTVQLPNSMNKLTFESANAIEKILFDIDTGITNMEQTWKYVGEVISGEGYMS